jgi:hypothetical protein
MFGSMFKVRMFKGSDVRGPAVAAGLRTTNIEPEPEHRTDLNTN